MDAIFILTFTRHSIAFHTTNYCSDLLVLPIPCVSGLFVISKLDSLLIPVISEITTGLYFKTPTVCDNTNCYKRIKDTVDIYSISKRSIKDNLLPFQVCILIHYNIIICDRIKGSSTHTIYIL